MMGGYELSHSTSLSQDANDPTTWSSDYSRRTSISTDSYYPSSVIDTEDEEEEENVVISEYFGDKDRTPVRNTSSPTPPVAIPMMYRPVVVQERPPPAVAMASNSSRVRGPSSSWEERFALERSERRSQQPPRPMSRAGTRSRTQEIVLQQPPRPASRASASASYFEGQQPRGFIELSRSPSATSTSTRMSEMSTQSAIPASGSAKGKCPHCYIHSWLPHSPQCPRRK